MDWSMATYWCKNMLNQVKQPDKSVIGFDGHADWRLPDIKELSALFDLEAPTRTLTFEGSPLGYKIKGGILLSGREWSSTLSRVGGPNLWNPRASSGTGALIFNFSTGQDVAFDLHASEGNRALCVRSGK
jgi:hypothetical protein